MKKTVLLLLLGPLLCFGQDDETFKPHLEKKNEIRIGIHNYTSSLEYERQITDHFSLGAVYRRGDPKDYLFDEFSINETLYVGAKARYYFKHFITHSFLYLFYDDRAKIRYFAESNLGYSSSVEHPFTERYLDNNSNYVLHRVTDKKNNNTTGSVGAGFKILYNNLFTFEFSFGAGQVLTQKDFQNFGYTRVGVGFRF